MSDMADVAKRKWRILAIDDDPKILGSYANILSPSLTATELMDAIEGKYSDNTPDSPFELVTANQGLKGVELVRQSMESGNPFSLALVDMRMPPGINGTETVAKIREIDKDIYFAIVTANTDHNIVNMQKAAERNILLLRKPFAPDELLQLIHNSCNSWDRDRDLETAKENLEKQASEHNQKS